MHLIYSDSFQNDEDLCRVLAALQLGSHPTSASYDPDTGVTQAGWSTQRVCNAGGPSLTLHDKTPALMGGPSGKYLPIHSMFCVLLTIFVVSGTMQKESIPDGVYCISLGMRMGVMNTWCVL